jgi:hypothetical protein
MFIEKARLNNSITVTFVNVFSLWVEALEKLISSHVTAQCKNGVKTP